MWLCDNKLSAHPSTLGSSKLQPLGQTWLIAPYGMNTLFPSIFFLMFLNCFYFLNIHLFYLAGPGLCFGMQDLWQRHVSELLAVDC